MGWRLLEAKTLLDEQPTDMVKKAPPPIGVPALL